MPMDHCMSQPSWFVSISGCLAPTLDTTQLSDYFSSEDLIPRHFPVRQFVLSRSHLPFPTPDAVRLEDEFRASLLRWRLPRSKVSRAKTLGIVAIRWLEATLPHTWRGFVFLMRVKCFKCSFGFLKFHEVAQWPS
ncbi:hypothetical protein TNCT_479551 [Trichonephila clavata]|uniref:Uncharacterized protein n=1 Tax=Trichonephila clavata TaxID=2740835 RepID=A0A8X6LQL2_TRICU|nr:hypothetical protein TNCT_464551 [Trichonephila clavata]GFR17007.1 hypothetical protein TNCT_479551 [Trichonephila clavata]